MPTRLVPRPSENHQRGRAEPTPRWGSPPFLCEARPTPGARRQHPLPIPCRAAVLGPRREETAQTSGTGARAQSRGAQKLEDGEAAWKENRQYIPTWSNKHFPTGLI